MKKKTFVVGIFVILMVCGLVLAGCDTGTNDTKQDVSNEQLFADVWAYFGCPDVNSWYDDNPAENSAFRFYESDDIADVAAAETYWDSLPNDKTFYESRWEPWERDNQWDKDVVYELQYHRGWDDIPSWFQIEINYSVEGKNTHTEGLRAVPGKIFEICQNMVNRINKK